MAERGRKRRLATEEIRYIFCVKGAAIGGVLAIVWGLREWVAPDVPANAALPAVLPSLLPTFVVVCWRGGKLPRSLLWLCFTADVLAATMCIHAGGGADMVSGPIAYGVIIGLAGMVLSEGAAWVVALECCGAYALLIWAEYAGLLADHGFGQRAASVRFGNVVAVGMGSLATAGIVSYAARQMQLFLERGEAARSRAIGELSGRLRAPLGVIRGYARLLRDARGDERRDFLCEVRSRGQQAVDIINNVLDLGRLELSPVRVESRREPVAATLERLRERYGPRARLGKVTVVVGCQTGLAVTAEPRLLSRALGNLLANAVDYSPPGGVVRIVAEARREATVFRVYDQGPGIRRLSHDGEEKTGAEEMASAAGLGLAVARGIARLHGGTLEIESVSDRGTCCTLTLPRCPAQEHRVGTTPGPHGILGGAVSEQEARRILMGKALALAGGVAVVMLLWPSVAPGLPLLAGGLVALGDLVATLAAAWWPGRLSGRALILSLAGDIAVMSVLIHFGGGVEVTAGPMLYLTLIGVAGLMLSTRGVFTLALACAAAYATVGGLEYAGWLAHRVPHWRPPERQLAAIAMVGGCLMLGAWVVSYAVRQMRWIYRRAGRLRQDAVGALAHDLKNPLAVVMGYAQMMEEQPQGDTRALAERMEHGARLALDLVHNVLDAAGGEVLITANVEPVRVAELIRGVVEAYGPAAADKGVELRSRIDSRLPLTHADPHLLTRALGNLVSNGVKYTDRGGSVEVSAAQSGGVVRIAVHDNGRGIALGEQSRLFEPYSRATSGRGVEGTGLGLYIVRAIAEAHGGRVSLKSAPGAGSHFTIELPLRAV